MFDSQRIRGVIPAMLTPLTEAGRVDPPAIGRLVEHLLGAGCSGIFTMGSTGEFSLLRTTDRAEAIRVVVDAVAGRVPVLAGASDSGTSRVVELVNDAAAAGADVAVVLPTYYMGATVDELRRHYDAVLASTDLPILLYNNPPSTGSRLPLPLVETLAENPQVVGIKDSSGDWPYFQRLLARFGSHPRFRVVQGSEALAAVSFVFGAAAAHLGLANVAPALFVRLHEAARIGDREAAFSLQAEVDELMSLWEIGGGTDSSYLNSMKTALSLMGVIGRGISLPYRPFGPDEVDEVRGLLERLDLLPIGVA